MAHHIAEPIDNPKEKTMPESMITVAHFIFSALLFIFFISMNKNGRTISPMISYLLMVAVYSVGPIEAMWWYNLGYGFYAVADLRLLAPIAILLYMWVSHDGEPTWGIIVSLIPILSTWTFSSLA